jgi:endonuclease/exonuclease/phosphatase family metal-dependent hydrolase
VDAAAGASSGPRLRLVSYNVHDLRDDPDAVAHVLRSLRCDVACLQEVPRRWFERPRTSRLARECGLRWVSGGRPSGGTAVFVGRRLDLVASDAFRLPARGRFSRRRGAATATVDCDGSLLTAVSVHLPLRPDERVSHARIVRARLAARAELGRATASLVIAGDLNEPPDGPAWAVLASGMTDAGTAHGAAPAPTFSARRPRRRIDAVLVGSGARVDRVVHDVPGVTVDDLRSASDHLPVAVDLLLSSGA